MRLWILALALLAAAPQEPREPDTILHRMGDLRWQHGGYITSIAVLPGDEQALSSAYTGTVVLWDLKSGQPVSTFAGHKGMIFSMALFPDGKRFVTGGQDKKVLLWSLDTATPVRELAGDMEYVRTVAVTSDGATIVAGRHDGQVRAWETATGKPRPPVQSPLGTLASLAVHGRRVLVDGPNKAAICDLDTGEKVREFDGPDADPNRPMSRGLERVVFTPDGRHAVGYFSYQGWTVWDVEWGKTIRLLGTKGRSYSTLNFSRDGRLAYLGTQKSLEVWDFEKAEMIRQVEDFPVYALALMEKSSGAVATSGDGSLAIVDLDTGKRLNATGPGEVYSLAATPDGRSVLAGSRDGPIRQWDLATGRIVRTFDRLSEKKYGDGSRTHDWASSIAILPDGRTAVSGHWDCRTALWDLATGKPIREYSLMHGTSVQGISLSPDGRFGAASGAPALTWNLESGELIRKFNIGPGSYTAITFSPDGKNVLIGSNSEKLSLFDAQTGELVHHFQGYPGRVVAIQFTPDGLHAVSGSESGDAPQLWEVSSGKSVRKFAFPPGTPPSWGMSLALSPDGRFLYSRGGGAELLVWSVETGKIVKSFSGHLHTVKAIALSPGGRFVTTGSQDTTLIHRHPGLPFKAKAQAWADAMKKDGEALERGWKKYMTLVRSDDYDVWTEAMERGVALGDAIQTDLKNEFRGYDCPVKVETRAAIVKGLEDDDVAARDEARKELSKLGEPGYSWARERALDPALSGQARAAFKSFCREIEALPVDALELKDLGELRMVLILIEQPASEKRLEALERFAQGPMKSVPSRLARRVVDQLLRR